MKRTVSILCAVLALWQAPASAADQKTTAQRLAANCANCHGTNGRTVNGTLPPLAGQPAGAIVAALKEFKAGTRQATIMHQLAKGYSDEQIALIADYFAAQK
ncbi:MAG TPA: c-type cytochrome [Paucimonas sp.]|nr:c-type cytochrome [Paucimonas sp.]